MKRWIIVLVLIIVAAVSAAYIFIPSVLVVSSVRNVKTLYPQISKFISSKDKLVQTIQAIAEKKDSGYSYKGFIFSVQDIHFNMTTVNISDGSATRQSNLLPLENTADSATIVWRTEIKTSANPFKRISQYYQAKNLKTSMGGLLDEMKKYLDNPANTYGVVVEQARVKDSTLISLKAQLNSEPAVKDVYALVKKLTDYARSHDALPTNSPMLNTTKKEEGGYEIMVGLPINKRIPDSNGIILKKMPYNGYLFISDVKGGPETIKNAMKLMRIYVDDSKRAAPAIPYELMITDRTLISDTSKWVTRLHFPII
jgi:hypothetical protein